MNFQQNWWDKHMYNKAQQWAYIAGYIYFMRSNHNNILDAIWDQTYLNANQINYSNVNSLVVKSFLLDNNNKKHWTVLVQYMFFCILAKYSPIVISKQKKLHLDGRVFPKY